jgi:hypothetical protein
LEKKKKKNRLKILKMLIHTFYLSVLFLVVGSSITFPHFNLKWLKGRNKNKLRDIIDNESAYKHVEKTEINDDLTSTVHQYCFIETESVCESNILQKDEVIIVHPIYEYVIIQRDTCYLPLLHYWNSSMIRTIKLNISLCNCEVSWFTYLRVFFHAKTCIPLPWKKYIPMYQLVYNRNIGRRIGSQHKSFASKHKRSGRGSRFSRGGGNQRHGGQYYMKTNPSVDFIWDSVGKPFSITVLI